MIVLTAPTGNVGAEVARLMVERTSTLPYRIAAHHPQKIHDLYGVNVACVKFDYDDHSTWDAVLADIDILFLIFPLPDPVTVNTRMKPFIDAAVKAGCQHIIYLSVPGADHLKFVPHYAVERHIEASGAAHTFLRASYFMQNLCRKVSTHGVDIATRNEIFIPAGKGKTSFLDARDIAHVVVKVMENPEPYRNKAYVVTGPENLDFYQVARIFTEVMGHSIRYARPSMPHFWYRLWKRGVTWDVIVFMTLTYFLTRLGKNTMLTDELPKLLGRPATKMPRFVKDYEYRWQTQDWT